MKKYPAIIRLIVITAALIGLGVVAFTYLHRQNNNNVEIQTISRGKQGTSHTSIKKNNLSESSQSDSSSDSCIAPGGNCSQSAQYPCCAGCKCLEGICACNPGGLTGQRRSTQRH